MRIIYLHTYFNTPRMEGITRSYELARRLVDYGHTVEMITSDREGAGRTYDTTEDGIHVRWIPNRYSNTMGFLQRVWTFVRFAVLSTREIARLDTDVIYASSPPLTNTIPAVLMARVKRVPLVLEVRDLWPSTPIGLGVLRNPVLKFLARRLELFAYRSAAHIVALSPDMKRGIVAAGIPECRVTVIPNASDLELFGGHGAEAAQFRASHEWLGDRSLVIYTGTLGQANRVTYMVRIAHEMAKLDPEVRFMTVGAGKETEKVRELARELGVYEKNFFMMPPLPKQEMPPLLAAADISTSFVVPVKEMWPNSANKFFDSLAAGKPIAINHDGWQADLLHEYDAGIVIDGSEPARAARELLASIRDAGWIAAAGKQARVLAEERFDREKLADELRLVLEVTASRGVNETLSDVKCTGQRS